MEKCGGVSAVPENQHSESLSSPLIPLPVIYILFHHIGMNIAVPLPKSWSGNRFFVLAIFDYAQIPKNNTLRTIDAK